MTWSFCSAGKIHRLKHVIRNKTNKQTNKQTKALENFSHSEWRQNVGPLYGIQGLTCSSMELTVRNIFIYTREINQILDHCMLLFYFLSPGLLSGAVSVSLRVIFPVSLFLFAQNNDDATLDRYRTCFGICLVLFVH